MTNVSLCYRPLGLRQFDSADTLVATMVKEWMHFTRGGAGKVVVWMQGV